MDIYSAHDAAEIILREMNNTPRDWDYIAELCNKLAIFADEQLKEEEE